MSPFHVPTTSLFHIPVKFPHFISLQHFPISRPSNVSLFHVPETFPYFTSMQQIPISHPCNMDLFHFPCSMSLFHVLTTYLIPLEHVLISHPWDILISRHLAKCPYFTSLWHVLILHPCNMSLFHILATGLHFMPLQHVPISCPSPQGWYYCPFFSCWLSEFYYDNDDNNWMWTI